MDRKKLVVRLIALGIVVAVAAGGGLIYRFLYETIMEKKLYRNRDNQSTILAKECQKNLDETAAKITQLPVNPRLISQITSEILKRGPITKLYFWMSDSNGEFVFGAPAPVFERLNKAYDKYQTAIRSDDYYIDRNDFLLKLVHRFDEIKFSQFEEGVLQKGSDAHKRLLAGDLSDNLRWRFYTDYRSFLDYEDPLILEFSAPVVNNNQEQIGTLYLKVDDRTVETKASYYHRPNFLNTILFPGFEVLFALSLFFLWFLLPSWVYIDARQRDVKNAVRWALLTAFSLGSAWLIYLIVRPTTLKSFHCPQCKKELNGTKAYCPHCGFDLSRTFCSQCQYPVDPGWQFCPSCRNDLTQKPQEAEARPA